jgi:hypothetical protein
MDITAALDIINSPTLEKVEPIKFALLRELIEGGYDLTRHCNKCPWMLEDAKDEEIKFFFGE